MWDAIQAPLPGMETPADTDPERDRVIRHLLALDPGGERMAAALRRTIDMLLDGRHTGRYRWDQLHKTEKTHAGTLVEINLQREFGFTDGALLDYSIAGAEVDCKFSQRLGGWMIPPEASGKLLLLVWASDEEAAWCAGLVRAREPYLRAAANRDLKRALNEAGLGDILWLHRRAPLAENALLRLPPPTVSEILVLPSGQQRVNELFRRAQGRRISRAVIATVAQQDDYMKRVRAGGGARDQLRAEGIVIFGDYGSHREAAAALGLPVPGSGEFVSARLARPGPVTVTATRHPSGTQNGSCGAAARVRLDGVEWVVAEPGDPVELAPQLPAV
jgi:Restriction endonuclease NaeI